MRKYAVSVIIVSLIALLGFLFISTYFQPVDSLIKPPKLEGENLSIQLAFESSIDGDYVLKQPLSGEYKSAYILADLTGDNDDEVVVFYSKSSELGIVHMNVLDKTDGEWASIADFQSDYNDIQEINFADLNGDGTKEIIVGWTVLGESYAKLMTIYQFSLEDKMMLRPIYSDYYSKFDVSDIDSDSYDDIISVKYTTAGNVAEYTAALLTYKNDEINIGATFTLDSSLSSVAAINFDYSPQESTTRVFVDGYKIDGGMVTDCLLWNKDNDVFERYSVAGSTVASLSLRNTSVLCSDINDDGIIEVPSEEFLPNISDNEANNLGQSLINWMRVTSETAEIVDRHIFMSQYGYRFRFSEKWLGNVSVSNDPRKGILTFWSVENSDGTIVKNKKLFSVMTITEIDLETIGEISFTYSQLMQLKGNLYYSKIFDAGVEYGITKKEIKQRIIAG